MNKNMLNFISDFFFKWYLVFVGIILAWKAYFVPENLEFVDGILVGIVFCWFVNQLALKMGIIKIVEKV